MPRRNADARDVFELLEACRFGGDADRLRSILDQCRFDLTDSKSALLILQASRSPATRDEASGDCEKLLQRRIVAAESRKRKRDEQSSPKASN